MKDRRGLPRWRRYLRFWGADPSADIADELTFHLEARVADLLARGVGERDAHAQARREFGDVERIRRELDVIGRRRQKKERRARVLEEGLADVRLSLRGLGRDPAYAAAMLVTLALVIAATTTVFGLLNGVLLSPLPYPQPDALVVAWERNVPRQRSENVALGASPARVRAHVLRGAAAVTLTGLVIGLAGAFALTRFMESLLFGVRPDDAATYGVVVALVLAVTLLAAWLPARRAAAVAPMQTMRVD